MTVGVWGECDRLRRIVTSRPGSEFDYMVPENLERYVVHGQGAKPNPDYLLFDDLVLRSAMTAEHDAMTACIRAVTGPAGQLDFRDLLAGALGHQAARDTVIGQVLELEGEIYGVADPVLAAAQAGLAALDPTRLADALVSGRGRGGSPRWLRWPAPNVLFARDLAACVGDAMVVTHAAEPARRRDMRLMHAVLQHHPDFRDTDIIDIADAGPVRGPEGPIATLEGGDIQVLSPTVALVGVGIRTTLEAAERLAARLFSRGFEAVLACEMPRRRAAMHIDTLFTLIDRGDCLLYPPMVDARVDLGVRVHRITPSGVHDGGDHLLEALADVGVPMAAVPCGGADPVAQAREQWSDGANAFALAPGVILTYGRNERTLHELGLRGFEVVEPQRFVRNAAWFLSRASADHRVAIALGGHELVRGRGGPRCLTMPLLRDKASS